MEDNNHFIALKEVGLACIDTKGCRYLHDVKREFGSIFSTTLQNYVLVKYTEVSDISNNEEPAQ